MPSLVISVNRVERDVSDAEILQAANNKRIADANLLFPASLTRDPHLSFNMLAV